MSLGTMSVKLAYKKAGIKWEEVDLQGMGIDNESIAKELAVRWDESSLQHQRAPCCSITKTIPVAGTGGHPWDEPRWREEKGVDGEERKRGRCGARTEEFCSDWPGGDDGCGDEERCLIAVAVGKPRYIMCVCCVRNRCSGSK